MSRLIKISFLPFLLIGLNAIVSCSGDNTSSTTTENKDTMQTNVPVNTAVNPNDSVAAKLLADSMNRVNKMVSDTANKMKAGTVKGKKGKVTINMANDMKSTTAMTADKDGYYSNVEVWPSYPGGQKALENYFENNVEYPDVASTNGTQGTVQVNFGVDENGKIISPKIVSPKIGDGIDEEALRLVKKMPSWTAGKLKGKTVKTRFTLPVRFELSE